MHISKNSQLVYGLQAPNKVRNGPASADRGCSTAKAAAMTCRRLKGQIELPFSYSVCFQHPLSYLLNVMVIDICLIQMAAETTPLPFHFQICRQFLVRQGIH